MLETPENGGYEGQKSTKMPILCSGASPMVRLIHSFNKYGRPASLYDLFWSPVWVLYSVLWLPNRCRRTTAAEQPPPSCGCCTATSEAWPPLPTTAPTAAPRTAAAEPLPHPEPLPPRRGYSFRPLMASRSLVSISSASSGLSSRTLFTPSRPWASLLSL